VLTLGRRQGDSFGPEDIATLQLLGGVAALALRNAWLFSEAQEAGRTKSEFLNMGAHELRTPLTVIGGYLSMLRDGAFGPMPAGWRHPVDMLTTKTSELTALVEDLLLASRMETGRLPLRRRRIDLRAAAKEAVDRAQVRARMHGGRVELRLPESAVEIEADADDVGHILDALIANAITYSPDAPEVTVTVEPWPRVRIAVQDRGRGIPDHERERIFERFYRVDDPDFLYQAGTGLGLYIARELARRHGGNVFLEWSRPGQGSRFVLELQPVR
jgi:signal transduction histidine kinase